MNIGFIGLGTMGSRMATNLLKQGHTLVIHDMSKANAQPLIAQGAQWADTPSSLGSQVELVFLSLPGPAQVQEVLTGLQGLTAGLSTGSAVFDFSTNSPRVIRELHAELAKKQLFFLDAPVSGGPTGAASGKLVIWTSGDEPTFNKYSPVLSCMSDDVQFLGAVGAASVAKLVHNCMGYMFNSAIAEVFSMGVKAGVEAPTLFKALRSGAMGRRRTFDGLPTHFLSGAYDPAKFSLKLAHKDVTLANELGREVELEMQFAKLTLAQMTEALDRGWGDKDSRIAMLLAQEQAGVDVRCDPETLKDILDR
jgi:3-hydroxyisobutyrate dehydrogenase-like beta-hydroxyacid dehydrogenase